MQPTHVDRPRFLPARLLVLLLTGGFALGMTGCDKEASGDASATPTISTTSTTSTPTAAATPAASPAPFVDGDADISFEFMNHDFGRVVDARTYDVKFPFTNTGDGTLIIRDVKAACGCTVPTLAKKQYAPGESGTINVTFNPKGKKGATHKFITVVSNATSEPAMKLRIDSDIHPMLTLERMLRMGQEGGTGPSKPIALGEEHVRVVPFTYTDPELKFTLVSVNSPHIEAEVISMGKAVSETDNVTTYQGELEVRVLDSMPWGVIYATRVDLAVFGRPNPGETPIQQTYDMFVLADVFGDLEASPTMISLGKLTRNTPFEKSSLLKSSTRQPFQILEARISESTAPGLRVRFEPVSAAAYRVTLYGNVGSYVGSARGMVEIKTSVESEGTLIMRFAGNAQP